MSFSEDPSSPAAPFSGDSSGQIFDLPDMVATSPTTTERVVDTQSGFLVVIKRLNDRLALSVKRRVGTPPSSVVPLTPDESFKLSRILSTSFEADDLASQFAAERKERRRGERRRAAVRMLGNTDESDTGDETGAAASVRHAKDDLVVPGNSLSSVHVPMKLMLGSVLRSFMVPILGIALTVFALGIGAGITGLKTFGKLDAPQALANPSLADPLETVKVDKFVRNFVADMLDFSSKTYRASQVHAMSVMSPDLLERYWQETNFPLSKRQLAGLPQGSTVIIAELKQERLDADTVQVDVHAQLTNPANPKIATPINLRLKLGLNADRQILINDQQDLSAVTK